VKAIGSTDTSLNDRRWALRSSSGREEFSGVVTREALDSQGAGLLLANLSLIGRFWPQPPFDAVEPASDELLTAYSVVLPNVILARNLVEHLISELTEWLVQPKEIAVELSDVRKTYQSIRISFGEREVLICSLEKPVCTITYASNSFEVGKWHFVVDQSCIRLFLEELEMSLRRPT
jgi:hypothetical protein